MSQYVNKVIKTLIISDFFLHSGWGFFAPIFAIFIAENIVMENPVEAAKVAGFAAAAYWITKSLLQIPIGHYLDKRHGEKDDFWFMVSGLFLAGIESRERSALCTVKGADREKVYSERGGKSESAVLLKICLKS